MIFAWKEWVSIALMVISGAAFYYVMRDYEYNSLVFPRMMVFIMLALAGIKIVVELSKLKRPVLRDDTCAPPPPFPFVRIFIVLVLTVAYIYVIEDLGFYTSAFLFFLINTYVLMGGGANPRSGRTLLIRGAMCLGFIIFLYLLFTVLLQTVLPRGILV